MSLINIKCQLLNCNYFYPMQLIYTSSTYIIKIIIINAHLTGILRIRFVDNVH